MKLAELAYIESKKISTFSVSLASSAFPCDAIGLESSAKGFMVTIYCTEILAGFSFFSGGEGERGEFARGIQNRLTKHRDSVQISHNLIGAGF